MPRLPLSILCDSQAHCTACRDLDGGRAWRENLLDYYDGVADIPEIHAAGVDFPCPRGRQWGEITPPPRPPESTPAPAPAPFPAPIMIPPGAAAICADCPDRPCPSLALTGCCGQFGYIIIAPCRSGRW